MMVTLRASGICSVARDVHSHVCRDAVVANTSNGASAAVLSHDCV